VALYVNITAKVTGSQFQAGKRARTYERGRGQGGRGQVWGGGGREEGSEYSRTRSAVASATRRIALLRDVQDVPKSTRGCESLEANVSRFDRTFRPPRDRSE